MPCHAMHPMQDLFFWKVFHKYYNLICIFICTPICTKLYSCKKLVLQHANMAKPKYGDGGVVDILTVDTYSRVEVCTPIFLGEASN
jgi:hypothetical protein